MKEVSFRFQVSTFKLVFLNMYAECSSRVLVIKVLIFLYIYILTLRCTKNPLNISTFNLFSKCALIILKGLLDS